MAFLLFFVVVVISAKLNVAWWSPWRKSIIYRVRYIFEKYHTRICAINSKPVTETEHEKRFVDSTTNINFLKDSLLAIKQQQPERRQSKITTIFFYIFLLYVSLVSVFFPFSHTIFLLNIQRNACKEPEIEGDWVFN